MASFGIPCPEPSPQDAVDTLYVNNQAMLTILEGLTSWMNEVLTQNAYYLKQVTTSLNRSNALLISNINKVNTEIITRISEIINQLITFNTVDINTIVYELERLNLTIEGGFTNVSNVLTGGTTNTNTTTTTTSTVINYPGSPPPPPGAPPTVIVNVPPPPPGIPGSPPPPPPPPVPPIQVIVNVPPPPPPVIVEPPTSPPPPASPPPPPGEPPLPPPPVECTPEQLKEIALSVAIAVQNNNNPNITLPDIVNSVVNQVLATANPFTQISTLGAVPVDDKPLTVSQGGFREVALGQPKMATTFPCPQLPDNWSAEMGVIGTPEWCIAAEGIISWLAGLGEKLSAWIDANTDPSSWEASVLKLREGIDKSSILGNAIVILIEFLAKAIKFAGNAVLTIKDAVKCSMFYAKILTPVRDPNAYTALVILKNIVAWIRESKIGSQSYLGFTVGTSLQIPQLEEYIGRFLDYLCCIQIPHIPEVTNAWLRNRISTENRDCLYRLHGIDPRLYAPFAVAEQERISAREMIQYLRRNGASEAVQIKALRNYGFTDETVQAQFMEMYEELPGIADHMHWLQRNVFDDGYVNRYRLMEGFTDRFWPRFGKDLRALGMREEYARLHYAAHWIQPSPTQMQEFVYRLRPGKAGVQHPFTVEDYQRILVEQDYAASAREWFAETVYKVPALSYLRDMHRNNLLTDEEMQSYHADLGYKERDSELFTKVDAIRKDRMRATQGHGWNPAAIAKGFASGALSKADVYAKMSAQHYDIGEADALMSRANSDLQYSVTVRARSRLQSSTVTQVRNALRVGIFDVDAATSALSKIGWQQNVARGIAEMESANAKVDRVKAAVAHLRRAYLSGEVDEEFAGQQLGLLGIVADTVRSYLSIWAMELTPNRKRRTAGQIVKDLSEATITTDDALARLTNLGYEDADRMLFLADAQRQMVDTEQSRAYAATLNSREGAAELSRLAKGAAGLSRRLVNQLRKDEPPSKLLKWMCQGVVGPTYVYQRMRLYGYDDATIERHIRGASLGKCDNPFPDWSVSTMDAVNGSHDTNGSTGPETPEA